MRRYDEMTQNISLPDVTLIAVSSVDLDKTQLALKISSWEINFAAIKFLSNGRPSQRIEGIEYVSIRPLNFLEYSRFILEELHQHVDTSHCLIVQADGFALNADLWRDEFLEYDYVGAPWDESVNLGAEGRKVADLLLSKNRVGNGGFSLRSKKLLELTAQINFNALDYQTKSEDLIICHYLYDEMIANGIRFASPELAARFSIESTKNLYGQDLNSAFGFHGKHWLPLIFGDSAQK